MLAGIFLLNLIPKEVMFNVPFCLNSFSISSAFTTIPSFIALGKLFTNEVFPEPFGPANMRSLGGLLLFNSKGFWHRNTRTGDRPN